MSQITTQEATAVVLQALQFQFDALQRTIGEHNRNTGEQVHDALADRRLRVFKLMHEIREGKIKFQKNDWKPDWTPSNWKFIPAALKEQSEDL